MTSTTVKKQTLASRINEILTNTKLTDPHQIAKEVITQMTEAEQLEGFAHILPAYVSSTMSYMSPPSPHTLAELGGSVSPVPQKSQGIKKPGKHWGKSTHTWDSKRLSSGLKPGEWVFWGDFSIEMCAAKIEMLNKRVGTMMSSVQKYALIESTLKANKVPKISALPVSAKAELEAQLGALPEDF